MSEINFVDKTRYEDLTDTYNQRNNGTQQLQPLRIPTGRRQASWLFTSAARKLNQGLRRTNSTSSHSGS